MMRNTVAWEEKGTFGGAPLAGPRAYALVAACIGLALVARLAMDPLWHDRIPYGPFFLAVVIITQFVGVGPAVAAVVGGFLLGTWFFVSPRYTFLIGEPVYRINALLYFPVCLMVVYFSLRMRRALAREQAARAALGRLAAIIESSGDAIIGRSLDGRITSWNAAAAALYGYTEAEAVGRPVSFLVVPGRGDELTPLLESVGRGEQISHFETARRRKDGELVDVSLSISPVRNTAGQIVGASTIARDITQRKQAERERERLVAELQKALGEVRTLSGLLPICAHCKKIRDDKGYWNQIEFYIRDHSRANFTHGICPDCAKHHYAPLFKDGEQPSAPPLKEAMVPITVKENV